MKNRPFLSRLWLFIWKSTLFFITFSIVLVLIYRWCPVPITPLMLIRLTEQEKLKLEHEWVNSSKIPNVMQLAVVCTEDQNYMHHNGFDFKAIERALDEAEDGGRIRGGSTISQQTAKNVFLWPSSTYLRKGFEVWFTFLIELFWPKQRIMEVYLNSIEFGDGIYGVEAASQHFFKHPAEKLNRLEAALLAVVLPNPLRFRANAPAAYLRRRQNWALRQMDLWGGRLNYVLDDAIEKKKSKELNRKK